MPLHGSFLTIDINQIGNSLECIETDTNGQCNSGVGYMDADSCQLLDKETQILESAQNQDVTSQSDNERPFASWTLGVADAQASEIIQYGAEEHQENIDRLTPCVEE